ncbi:MAG: tRNA pseudouridine(55) synthase TruB [Clostridia bacterium]|nr:tRNA pseudouridine(55) synthase TruB [Oscillospiraceae bacterium]MBQ1955591.1 tRNA pseudouridine(55) synthase TruB [Clostridia bacterium]
MTAPKSGIVLIDKKEGFTSQAAVFKVRRCLGSKSAGHTGTLDPLATGLLVVCYGRATRVTEYLGASEKRYTAVLKVGTETDTGDITGNVIRTSDMKVTSGQVEAALADFRGAIKQVPPIYSAIWVNGRRLYEIARNGEGETVEIPERDVEIHSLELISSNEEAGEFTLDVCCSKGTYIRSLCRDIGIKIGCFGTMAALRRTAAGCYSVKDALTPDEISDRVNEGDFSFIMPIDSVFSELPIAVTDPRGEKYVRDGAPVPSDHILVSAEGRCRLYNGDAFIAVGEIINGEFITEKNFHEVL